MMFEEGHPIISLSDWQGFKSWQKSLKVFPSHLIVSSSVAAMNFELFSAFLLITLVLVIAPGPIVTLVGTGVKF